MATLISDGKVHNLDPAYVGRWTGAVKGPMGDPDRCYYCGIGERGEAIGFVSQDASHYGVCEQHATESTVRYPNPPTVTDVPAHKVKKGMALLVDPYCHGSVHLRQVTKVSRVNGLLRIYFGTFYMVVDRTVTFQQMHSRFGEGGR